MTDPLYTRGMFVTLTIGDWSTTAMIALASPNGRSLMLMFDGAAPVNQGFFLGALPVLRHDDGVWRDLTGTTVEVMRRD